MTSASSSSSSPSTALSTVDIEANQKKREYQWRMLSAHQIFIHDDYYSRLVQHGMIDHLVKVLEDIDREAHEDNTTKEKVINTPSSTSSSSRSISSNSEDEDETTRPDSGHVQKKMKTQNKFSMDVAVQTDHTSTYHFFDPNASEQHDLEPGYTYWTKSFYDPL